MPVVAVTKVASLGSLLRSVNLVQASLHGEAEAGGFIELQVITVRGKVVDMVERLPCGHGLANGTESIGHVVGGHTLWRQFEKGL